MESEKKSGKGTGIVIGIIVVVVIALIIIFSGSSASQQAPADQASSSTLPVGTASTTPGATASLYKDGTYSATGSYLSPGGPDQIAVTLTLANDIVTDVSVTPMPGDNTSAKYQSMFAAGYKQYVVGMNIASVNLTKVSGSSLTPKGFDDALSQIKTQAQA